MTVRKLKEQLESLFHAQFGDYATEREMTVEEATRWMDENLVLSMKAREEAWAWEARAKARGAGAGS